VRQRLRYARAGARGGVGGRGDGARVLGADVYLLDVRVCGVYVRAACVCLRSEFQPKNILFTGAVCVCARACVRQIAARHDAHGW
jgi:hypothetical protein